MKELINSFRGYDGQFSSRRITAFWFVVLTTLAVFSLIIIVYLMIFGEVVLSDYSIRAGALIIDLLYILCAMILLLFGIVTSQQILNFKASNPSPPPIVENAENVNVKKEDEN